MSYASFRGTISFVDPDSIALDYFLILIWLARGTEAAISANVDVSIRHSYDRCKPRT